VSSSRRRRSGGGGGGGVHNRMVMALRKWCVPYHTIPTNQFIRFNVDHIINNTSMNYPIITNITPAATTYLPTYHHQFAAEEAQWFFKTTDPRAISASLIHHPAVIITDGGGELRWCIGAFTGSLPAFKVKVRRWKRGGEGSLGRG